MPVGKKENLFLLTATHNESLINVSDNMKRFSFLFFLNNTSVLRNGRFHGWSANSEIKLVILILDNLWSENQREMKKCNHWIENYERRTRREPEFTDFYSYNYFLTFTWMHLYKKIHEAYLTSIKIILYTLMNYHKIIFFILASNDYITYTSVQSKFLFAYLFIFHCFRVCSEQN